jgi:septal ring factor EnvC (AmiA/AmiB activator)
LAAANKSDQAKGFFVKAEQLAPSAYKPQIDQLLAQLGSGASNPSNSTGGPSAGAPTQAVPAQPPQARSIPPPSSQTNDDADEKQAKIDDLQRQYNQLEDDANAIENAVAEYGQCTGMFSAICDAHNASQLRKAKEDRQQMTKIGRQLAALGASPA